MKTKIHILSAIVIAAGVPAGLFLGLYCSAVSWNKAFDSGTPGMIDVSEIPHPLRLKVEEMGKAGIDTKQIETYRVYGEYDMDQTTVCRLPYSSDVLQFLIEQLGLKTFNNPRVSDHIAQIKDSLSDRWRITSDLNPKMLANDQLLEGEEGPSYCLIYVDDSAPIYLYFDVNF